MHQIQILTTDQGYQCQQAGRVGEFQSLSWAQDSCQKSYSLHPVETLQNDHNDETLLYMSKTVTFLRIVQTTQTE